MITISEKLIRLTVDGDPAFAGQASKPKLAVFAALPAADGERAGIIIFWIWRGEFYCR